MPGSTRIPPDPSPAAPTSTGEHEFVPPSHYCRKCGWAKSVAHRFRVPCPGRSGVIPPWSPGEGRDDVDAGVSDQGEPVPGPHTGAEVAAHVRAGVGETCLVCGGPIIGDWTDYTGQVRCACGTTYQILGNHLTPGWLAGHGMTPADVARRYCDCYEWVPLLRAYWAETHTPVPFGSYFGESPVSAEHVTRFYSWVAQNESRLRPAWDAHFDWDALLAHYADSFEGGGL